MDKKVFEKEWIEAVKLKSLLKQAAYLFQKGNEWWCQSPDNYRLKQENQEKGENQSFRHSALFSASIKKKFKQKKIFEWLARCWYLSEKVVIFRILSDAEESLKKSWAW